MSPATLRQQVQSALSHRYDVSFALREKKPPAVLPSGIPDIEIPRGTFTEVAGPPSSGRTGVVTAVLARATHLPEFCAWIDASDSFDPGTAALAGVELHHLLWVRCGGHAENALKATDLIMHAGGFGLVVLDLAGLSSRDAGRISLASWYRLRSAVEKTATAFVVLGEGLHARSCSTLQIQNRRVGAKVTGKLFRGFQVAAETGPRHRGETGFSLPSAFQK